MMDVWMASQLLCCANCSKAELLLATVGRVASMYGCGTSRFGEGWGPLVLRRLFRLHERWPAGRMGW
jgi:hypothetical protein